LNKNKIVATLSIIIKPIVIQIANLFLQKHPLVFISSIIAGDFQ